VAILRANVERLLVKRVGGWMSKASLDATTVDGTNDDLDDPIAWALGKLDVTLATWGAPVDADLASVATSDGDALIDLAEYRLLQNILGNFTKVDVSSPAGAAQLDDLGQRIERRLKTLQATIAADYGIAVVAVSGTLAGGTLTLAFADVGSTDE
jgi:hypothetical protein